MNPHALPNIARPMLARFYRAHRSAMRCKGLAQAWVIKDPVIIAALCLTPVYGGHWLTGLFVAPERRGQGLAARLIEAATDEVEGKVWLFCDPEMEDFYRRVRFERMSLLTQRLPEALAVRFTTYTRTKPLIAMCRPPR